ncbi:hypothetical protein PHLCEN_2v123 [Hermanssonia centrifuga]|uniref:Uncharacterized protein n=1 Tax=Hermanssonia centrifuga TaxID=98765 RepID=A0A2R6S6Y4_9APHY|nr:hypothetical protein PHLCEN_2v123 [Hermanssonia centrifuga]
MSNPTPNSSLCPSFQRAVVALEPDVLGLCAEVVDLPLVMESIRDDRLNPPPGYE